ncbi:MAG: NTP transferase domain-containing protein [Oscillospiraceae bacterium]|nr:NTP transferase domain-containing protein [Oscillospiraceae bacterium]
MNSQLKAIVLAAGKGTRLQSEKSDVPKVMREVCGRPLLSHVLDALPALKKDIIIVVGFGKDRVIDHYDGYEFAYQERQLGTGHAVLAAKEQLSGYEGAVLICYGDMPVIKRETYESLLQEHFKSGNDCTILTGESSLPEAFGRIIRDDDGAFLRVVEERDCNSEQLKITELNTGVYVFEAPKLLSALNDMKNHNDQGEYYLTDVPEIMRLNGAKIGLLCRDLGDEILGVNTVEQLALAEEILSSREPNAYRV